LRDLTWWSALQNGCFGDIGGIARIFTLQNIHLACQ
jgi:hypothetical protein